MVGFKKRSSQHLSPATIQSLIVQLPVPLWVDESHYKEHFQERENAAPPLFTAVLSCSLQPVPRSYLTVLKIIHPLPLLPWQQEGKSISSASSSHSLLPFLLSLSLIPSQPSFSLSLYAISCYSSFFRSESGDRHAGSRRCSFLNKQNCLIPCFSDSYCTFVFG